ncbi:MAG TPA: riboflavin synthase [Actinomycetota bacterium]|jgi:riboflavin synthase|nr:riboflavin synthase [Actinomycetota bacterium]
MFTGIVEELGTVRALDGARLVVGCPLVATDSPIGASVAVNGTCLTVVERTDGTLAFDLSGETLDRTTLGSVHAGSSVNLERPVSLAARLGGHLVQGHVDGVGQVAAIARDPDGGATLTIHIPGELEPLVVQKGSIAIDGVSLTVAALDGPEVQIALIPHTLAATTLGAAAVGDLVNIEVDMIGRYVAHLMERSGR